MAYNVLIQRKVAAANVDSYNRNAVYSTTALENGDVFSLTSYSQTTGEGEVWAATLPIATSTGLWMAYSPEIVTITDGNGNQYMGLTRDPRAYNIPAGTVFDAFKLNVDDIIEMTGAGYTNIATSDYLVAGTTQKLVPAAAATTGTTLQKIGTGVLHLNDGSIGGTSVPTYKYRVVIA